MLYLPNFSCILAVKYLLSKLYQLLANPSVPNWGYYKYMFYLQRKKYGHISKTSMLVLTYSSQLIVYNKKQAIPIITFYVSVKYLWYWVFNYNLHFDHYYQIENMSS